MLPGVVPHKPAAVTIDRLVGTHATTDRTQPARAKLSRAMLTTAARRMSNGHSEGSSEESAPRPVALMLETRGAERPPRTVRRFAATGGQRRRRRSGMWLFVKVLMALGIWLLLGELWRWSPPTPCWQLCTRHLSPHRDPASLPMSVRKRFAPARTGPRACLPTVPLPRPARRNRARALPVRNRRRCWGRTRGRAKQEGLMRMC